MRLGVDAIGAMIFVGDADHPVYGTLHIEYTDRENDEFGLFIRYGKKDINVYVTCELWEQLYKMAQRDFPVRGLSESAKKGENE